MMAPRSGRPTPRMAETPSGMLNSIGLQGPGIEAFLEKDLAWLASRKASAVVSIAGGSVEEYAKLATKLRNNPAVTMIEVNISCPNVEDRGQVFACDPQLASAVIQAVTPQQRQGRPGLRQALARRHRHRRDRQGVRRRRRRRAVAHQHLAGHGHRHHDDAPGARWRDRWAVRSGHPPGRRALRLPGPGGAARRADPGHGWDPHRARRAGVLARRRQRRQRRDHRLRRPDAHPCASCASSRRPWPTAASIGSRTSSGWPTAHPALSVPEAPDPLGDELTAQERS